VPPSHEHATPVATAGVNTLMCRTAGEVADAFQVHPLHTPAYLRDVIIPAIRRGERRAGRDRTVTVNASVFAVVGETERELHEARDEVRRTIAFYASTPSYRPLLAHHGWDERGAQLSALAARGEWAEMAEIVSDEMLETIAVSGSPDDIGRQLTARYRGLADRVGVYAAFRPDWSARWTALLTGARG
jgi:probable F420-dependent oxidoreductase